MRADGTDRVQLTKTPDVNEEWPSFGGIPGTTIRVTNVAPTLSDLSATPIFENGTTTLSGTIADVGTLDTFEVEIDWNADGTVDETHEGLSAGTFFYTHQYLDDDPTGTPVDNMPIQVTVTDDDTGSVSAETTVEVTNVAPVIQSVTSSASECGHAAEGVPVTLSGRFSDVGTLDTHTASIDWGDGTVTSATISEAAGSGSIAGEHAYAAGGIYTITVDLLDDDTGADSQTTIAVVTGAGVNQGVLYVIGTQNDDHVTVNAFCHGHLKVHANFLPGWHFRIYDGAGIDTIVVLLGGGNDLAAIAGNVTQTVLLDGGPGNDLLNGGGGRNVLWGGPGCDLLIGGPRRDILIGGTGSDRLVGNGGDDILVAGGATVDPAAGDPPERFDLALLSLLGEWSSFKPLGKRMRTVRSRMHAFDDIAEDMLTGSAGQDWFFARSQGPNRDKLTDRKGDEILDELV
jgi:Ca2+-binding RTX toxin-like protein